MFEWLLDFLTKETLKAWTHPAGMKLRLVTLTSVSVSRCCKSSYFLAQGKLGYNKPQKDTKEEGRETLPISPIMTYGSARHG